MTNYFGKWMDVQVKCMSLVKLLIYNKQAMLYPCFWTSHIQILEKSVPLPYFHSPPVHIIQSFTLRHQKYQTTKMCISCIQAEGFAKNGDGLIALTFCGKGGILTGHVGNFSRADPFQVQRTHMQTCKTQHSNWLLSGSSSFTSVHGTLILRHSPYTVQQTNESPNRWVEKNEAGNNYVFRIWLFSSNSPRNNGCRSGRRERKGSRLKCNGS